MSTQEQYTQRLGLANLDVYLETPENNNSYFNITGLPPIFGYGKHGFKISYNDPIDGPLLKQNTGILFEFVDSNGETIFSELSDIPDFSGAASAYLWIKKDPLWTAQEISNGPVTLYVVGELEDVPEEFEGTYNLRSTFSYEIRKSLPNTSPIIFYDVPAIETSASISGDSVEFDQGSTTFSRGYINVSSSFLQTHGGQVSFIELSYKESGSRTDQYTVLTQYPLLGSSSRFEVQDSGSVDGLNPISHEFKMPVPRDFRRDTEVFFKLRFLDANKAPAKHYSETRNNQEIEITSSAVTVNGTPFIIEKEDNLLKGSMYTGNAVGKGFEQSGKSSAYLKTVDYTGFISASTHIGSPGVMFFSGSVLTESGDNYEGVGLELVGDSESFFRFRSDPSVLDIRAQSFFVGSEKTQFISASGGIIEISSSKFHLSTSGDVKIIGDIDADGGTIGGFEIQEDQINSTNQDIIFKANGQISASSLLLASGSFVIDPNNLSRFGEDGFGSFVMADNTGVKIQTSDFNLNTARFIISSSDVGVMAMGSTPPSNWDNGKGIYMSGDGEFLAGDSAGERMQFNGFNLVLSSSAFFLGNQDSFMSGSNGKILISGSDIGIQTPRFFFGDANKFISGALGNLEISSSRFHLDVDGNVKLIGRIEANDGLIGGFGITENAITGSNFFISGGAVNNEFFISSSNFNVKASGDITGSQVLFQGGKIAAFNLSEDALSTDSFFISASATGNDLFISASSFNVNALGIVTASALSLEGGDVGGLVVSEGTISVGEILKLKDSGQVTGSDVLFSGGTIGGFDLASTQINSTNDRLILKSSGQITASDAQLIGKVTATSGQIAGWTISGTTLVGNNATLDGAGSALFKSDAGPDTDNSAALDELRNEYYIDFSPSDQGNTRNFFVKFGPNFMVDSEGILIASGAKFSGTITASAGLIGGFTTDSSSFHSTNIFISGSPAIGGTDHPRFMFISSSNFNVKESGDITGSSALFDGNINVTGTGTIGGFVLDSSEIRSSNNNLRLKSSGNITGSQVLFTGGTIGGFDLSSTQINSTNDNLILKSSGQITASDAQIQGKITAQSGTIGGFNIGTDLDSTAGTLKLKGATGQITASDAQITGKITAETGTIGGFNIGTDLDSTAGTLKLKGATGQITASDAQISGKVTATSGQIAGFTIDGNTLTATNFTLDASGKRVTLGTGTDIFIADGDEGIQLGNSTFALAPFSVTKAGILKATAGTIGGFGISANSITSSNNNLLLKDSGQITGSTVLFTGGKVGGFKITSTQITSSNLLFDSGNSKLVVGSANKITIQGGGTDNFITMGSKTDFAQTSTAGIILGMDNNVPSFDLTRNANNYVRFDTSTGVDIKTDTFKLDTATLDIDSSTSRIQVVNGSSNEVVRFGEISDAAGDHYGLKVYDGSGTADSNTLVKLGGEGNTIGGWTITNDQIQSAGLIIHSSGRLETSDFASGVKGWRISAEGNGEAEFENVTIRGTLSTAVFEKETVNAVGGQLYIANSTALTGSGQISASFDTMSVVNVSGFVQGEILSLKKVTETGFTTEYVLVNSASRDDRSSDTNFAGKLMVTRGYGRGTTGDSGSLGGSPATSQSYEPGQVIVSTGKVGTGYIRLNANPNDQATPYMDIVERTGTGIYDIELKTRVGDLSGLSSATLFGNANPGFGIFTENGFFKGGINATTGSFTGVVHINTSASEIMKLGTNVSGTDDGIHINTHNYWYTTGQFKLGDSTNNIAHDGSGDISITTDNFSLKGGSTLLMNTTKLAFDTSNASTAALGTGTGVFMDTSGNFRVGVSGGNRLTFSGTSIELVTDDLNIDTTTFDVSTDNGGKIAMGATPPTSISSGTGIFMSGSGEFLAGNASGNHIKFSPTTGNVSVAGQITITAGSDISAAIPDGTVSGSAQLSDAISGSFASTSASLATDVNAASSSAGTAQANLNSVSSSVASELNTVSSSAGQGISSANTATAAASDAQSAIDTMETQVDLTATGMHLKKSAAQGGTKLVTYGTTTKFFDGVGEAEGNMKLRLNTDGVFAFANTTESFARFYSQGVQIVSGSTEYAKFAGTTTIGNTSTEHVELTATSLKLKDGGTTRLSMDSSGMQIGSVSNGITLNSDGNATFNGEITIGSSLAASISGSLGSVSSSLAAEVTAASSSAGQGIATANTANTAANDASSLASNLAAGAEASASAAETNASNLASGLAAGSVASASAAETLASNLAAGSRDSASAASSAASTAQNAIDTMETQVVLSNEGMSLRAVNDAGNGSLNGQDVVQFGTTTKFFDGVDDQDANRKLQLNADGIFAFGDDTNTFTKVFSKGIQIVKDNTDVGFFSEVVRVGALNQQHVSMSSAGVTFMNSAVQTGKISGHGALIGKTNEAHISASTTEINVIKDSNNKAILGADGLIISQSGNGVGEFASTTRIGNRGTEHVEITNTSLKLKDAATDLVTVSGTTVTIGSDSNNRVEITPSSMQIGSSTGGITMDSNGDATFKGTITVGSLPGGTVSGSAQLADAISGSVGEFSSSAASSIAGTANDSSSMAAAVQLTSTGLNVLNDSSAKLAEFGADVFVGLQNAEHVKLSDAGLELKDNTDVVGKFVVGGATIGKTAGAHISASTTDVNIIKDSSNKAILDADGLVISQSGAGAAKFASTTTIGNTGAEHLLLNTSGLAIKDNTTVVGKFSAHGATLGKTAGGHISASTTDVSIIQDANHKAVVDASGLKVIEGGNTVAQFAATSVIGSSTDKVTINDSGITIRENNIDKIQLVDGQVKVGNTGADEDKVYSVIADDGFIVSSSEDGNSGEIAKFGETTTIGRTDSDHVRISSNSVSIKTDANTTVLSASAAGLAMSGRVTAGSGEIGGFSIGDSELSIGQVFLTSSLGGQAGLVIKDGEGDNILTVVSQSGGQTNINELTGSTVTGAVDANLLDFGFELGSNGEDVDDDSDSLWTISQTDGAGGSAIGHWQRSTSATFVREGSQAAVCPQFTINATDIAARNTMQSSMARIFPSKTGVLATFSALAFAQGFIKFGDRGAMRATMTMTLEGSAASNMSSPTTIATRRITSLNSRPTTMKVSWKNPYAYVRATFNVSITPGLTKATSVATGNFIVDNLKYTAGSTALPSGFKATRVKPLVELSQDGLLIFSNPKEFLKVNDEGFELRGDIDSVNLSVESDAVVTGSLTVLGDTTFSGSLLIDESIPFGVGTNQPLSKFHIVSDFSSLDDFIDGDPPVWRWEKHQYSVRGKMIPLTDSDDNNFVQAAFGTDMTFDAYRVNSSIVYGEQYTGQSKGFAGAGHDMSQSVSLGHVRSFTDHKDQQGLRIYQNVGSNNTNQGDMRRYGAEITQFANITDTSGDDYTEMGIFVKQQGAFSQDPRNLDSDSRARDEYSAAYGAANQRTGTYRNANWGLAISGSGWPSWIGGKLGVGDRMQNPSCALDVNGTIRASADVVAYYSSDERLKTNIKTIEEPIYKLRQLRGVEYEWNDKQDTYPSGSLDSGIIAQDVQKVLPQLVKERNDGYLGVRHDRLVGLLVEAIKDQQDQIDEMKDQIKELKNGSS